MNHTIMLVDDDETIIETLEYNLRRHGFEIASFKSGKEALSGLDKVGPDLIILDWMLGDMCGPDVCKVIRLRSSETSILMLTGRAAKSDVAFGLESGADDYLCKPFSTIELMARVQALLRRTQKKTAHKQLKCGQLVLDNDARNVLRRGLPVELSPKEFVLLRVLMENAGKTLSTEALLNQVWGSDFTGDTKTVAVHIRWLRQKLEDDPKSPKLLTTVQRSGYRLELGHDMEAEI